MKCTGDAAEGLAGVHVGRGGGAEVGAGALNVDATDQAQQRATQGALGQLLRLVLRLLAEHL